MKRKIALLMALTLATTSFVACGKDTDKKETSDNKPAAVVEEQQEPAEEQVAASAPEYAITSVAAEGYDYFTGKIECIQITDDKHEALKKAIDEYFSGYIKNFNDGAESSNEEAKEFNEENKQYADEEGYEYETVKYEDNIAVQVARCDDQVFSFVVMDYYYTGGAHGMTSFTGVNFDAKTGKQIGLEDCGDKAKYADISKNFILSSIEESDQNAKDYLFNDEEFGYKSTIEQQFSDEVIPEYYLGDYGVTFMFQQYDIAPYAAGSIKFIVPYSELPDFDTSYIPEQNYYSFVLDQVGLSAKADANGDGTLDKISFCSNNTGEEGASSDYTLTVGADTLTVPVDQYDYAYASYVHTADENYIIINVEGKSINLYSVSNGIKNLGSLGTELSIKEIKDGEIVLGQNSYEDGVARWTNEETHKYSKKGIQ